VSLSEFLVSCPVSL